MRVVLASLTTTAERPRAGTPAVVTDLLWAHALPEDGLEHVKPRATDLGIDLYLFVDAEDDAPAVARMRPLLERARRSIAAQGYSLTAD
ncbi:hypothetical protein JK359_14740 [Streptomyces actinomycinicus]|uniref:Uncharacterized protein n=1 Tax=Streptomyces actinomycinicus TaxID=1695166 RepID=A0A937JM75_9ACTN|nr:hypothetical protein [Streptomyces actinomycinicus]MBL1083230.1 hypothetical protein [Streptomyces actinomycinicus]